MDRGPNVVSARGVGVGTTGSSLRPFNLVTLFVVVTPSLHLFGLGVADCQGMAEGAGWLESLSVCGQDRNVWRVEFPPGSPPSRIERLLAGESPSAHLDGVDLGPRVAGGHLFVPSDVNQTRFVFRIAATRSRNSYRP